MFQECFEGLRTVSLQLAGNEVATFEGSFRVVLSRMKVSMQIDHSLVESDWHMSEHNHFSEYEFAEISANEVPAMRQIP